jgi:digeranylgeranylglycerophospholipid reductase
MEQDPERMMTSAREKIVIVGAGPVGCYLGRLLMDKGFDPMIIEEHEELGRPVHCAGLIGDKVITEMRIPFPTECILNDIDGAVIMLGDEELSIGRKKVAHVIDREKFDKTMGTGLDILFGTRYVGVEQGKGKQVVETDRGSLPADIVIGADGANSLVRKTVIGGKPLSFLKGAQLRIKRAPEKMKEVKVFVKKPYFYWIIPESRFTIRVGVISKNPYQDLLSFVEEKRLEGDILEKYAGLVLKSNAFPISRGRVFLVGDAAAQTKPLTYGGVYMGMRAAEILADTICDGRPEEYPSIWSRRFGKEVELASFARSIFEKLGQRETRTLYAFIAENADLVEGLGDFDRHSDLLMEFVKRRVVSARLRQDSSGKNK